MESIEIMLAGRQPPTGTLQGAGAPVQPFTGWVQLLRLLSDLLGAPPGMGGSEFDARGDAELGQHVGDVRVDGVP